MSLQNLCRLQSVDKLLRLGPTDVAVVLKNGRPIEVRRSGKYRRLFGKERLGAFGDLQALVFDGGEIPVEVNIVAVPLADDFSVDCKMHVGVRLVGGDDTLFALTSRFKPADLIRSAESELLAVTSGLVKRALAIARHNELQRVSEFEELFRAGRRLLDGALEIVAIRQFVPKYDAIALAELEERKRHNLDVSRAGRKHELAMIQAASNRELSVFSAATTAQIGEIEMGSKARIASRIGRELGVPPWWIFNPNAHTAEMAANRDLLVNVLGKYGSEFSFVADQFGLSREDFLSMFSGFQQSAYTAVTQGAPSDATDRVVTASLARSGDPDSPQFSSSAVVERALEAAGLSLEAAGSSIGVTNDTCHAILVVQNVSGVRARSGELERHLLDSTHSLEASIAVVPYKARTGDQLESIAQSIMAENGLEASVTATREAENSYSLAADHVTAAEIQVWTPAITSLFRPDLNLRIDPDTIR